MAEKAPKGLWPARGNQILLGPRFPPKVCFQSSFRDNYGRRLEPTVIGGISLHTHALSELHQLRLKKNFTYLVKQLRLTKNFTYLVKQWGLATEHRISPLGIETAERSPRDLFPPNGLPKIIKLWITANATLNHCKCNFDQLTDESAAKNQWTVLDTKKNSKYYEFASHISTHECVYVHHISTINVRHTSSRMNVRHTSPLWMWVAHLHGWMCVTATHECTSHISTHKYTSHISAHKWRHTLLRSNRRDPRVGCKATVRHKENAGADDLLQRRYS